MGHCHLQPCLPDTALQGKVKRSLKRDGLWVFWKYVDGQESLTTNSCGIGVVLFLPGRICVRGAMPRAEYWVSLRCEYLLRCVDPCTKYQFLASSNGVLWERRKEKNIEAVFGPGQCVRTYYLSAGEDQLLILNQRPATDVLSSFRRILANDLSLDIVCILFA